MLIVVNSQLHLANARSNNAKKNSAFIITIEQILTQHKEAVATQLNNISFLFQNKTIQICV